MTIPEAAGLVLQASGMAEGGDTFLLDMGKPIRISDLAVRMVQLSGKEPFMATQNLADQHGISTDGNIEVNFTGLRPGEKLYEELLIDDASEKTSHPRILRANEVGLNGASLSELLSKIQAAVKDEEPMTIRFLMDREEIGYRVQRPTPVASEIANDQTSPSDLVGASAVKTVAAE
jgi:FlaA1/EpsC-like NDP-sugar epimerase